MMQSGSIYFSADQMGSPNNNLYPVSDVAGFITYQVGLSIITLRTFDDSREEGVCVDFSLPNWARAIEICLKSKLMSVPKKLETEDSEEVLETINVVPRVYFHMLEEGPQEEVIWTDGLNLIPLDFEIDNNLYQAHSQILTLQELGLELDFDKRITMELTRNSPLDTLVGDWLLSSFEIKYSS